jgi:hypothetical protein
VLGEVLKDAARGTTEGEADESAGSFVASQLASRWSRWWERRSCCGASRASRLDPGYVPEHILCVPVYADRAGKQSQRTGAAPEAFLAQVVERAAALPGVESAAVVMACR